MRPCATTCSLRRRVAHRDTHRWGAGAARAGGRRVLSSVRVPSRWQKRASIVVVITITITIVIITITITIITVVIIIVTIIIFIVVFINVGTSDERGG